MRNKIIGIVIAVAVLGLFAFGILDRERTVGWIRHYIFRARGVASQVGSGKSPTGNVATAKICRENLSRIQAAKRKAAFDRGQTVGAVSWEDVLVAMNLPGAKKGMTEAEIHKLMPKCPDGGTYNLGNLQEVARCSIGGNDSLSLDDDHVIRD
jgi:hypothetical protein